MLPSSVKLGLNSNRQLTQVEFNRSLKVGWMGRTRVWERERERRKHARDPYRQVRHVTVIPARSVPAAGISCTPCQAAAACDRLVRVFFFFFFPLLCRMKSPTADCPAPLDFMCSAERLEAGGEEEGPKLKGWKLQS